MAQYLGAWGQQKPAKPLQPVQTTADGTQQTPSYIQSPTWGQVPMATATKFAPLLMAEQQGQVNKQAAVDTSRLSNPNITNPYGSQAITYNPDGSVNVNQAMNPSEQGLYDLNTRIRQGMAGAGASMLPQLGVYGSPMDTSNLPGRTTNVQYGNILQGLDTSSLPSIPGMGDLSGFRQQAQDAAYQRNTQYLDPQFANAESDLRSRLANQGVTEGSDAWNRDFRTFADTKQRAYDSARAGAVQQGLAEQQAQYDMGANTRNQLYGELLSSGQFANQAQGQGFAQGLSNADLTNAQRAAQLQEQLGLRELPLQELAALASGGQYNLPEFQNFQGANVNPSDYQGALADIMGLQKQQDAAKKANSQGLLNAGIQAASIIAAPFTGGASLALGAGATMASRGIGTGNSTSGQKLRYLGG